MRTAFTAMLATAATIMLCGADAATEGDVQPTNDLPNPYQTTAPWGKLPDGRTWGALNGVAIDNDGESVWVADRCGANPDIPPGASPFQYDSCAGSTLAPVLKFDASGNLLKSFGAGMFIFPHKIYVDRDGNVWVVDGRGVNERERKQYPQDAGKGHTVVKFSPDGKVLLTIGKAGVAGNPPDALTEPTSIVVAPNGDIFIAEGHCGQAPDCAAGHGRADFEIHAATASSSSRSASSARARSNSARRTISRWMRRGGSLSPTAATCASRSSIRTERSSREWKQFSRPSGVYIRDELIYVADSESNGVAPHPGWKRGIRDRQPQGRQSPVPHSRSAGTEGHQRRGRPGGRRARQCLRRGSRAAAVGKTQQVGPLLGNGP